MKEDKLEITHRYFADRSAACKAQFQALSQDNRADEAIFAKIQMNVYDIFSAVFSAAVKTAGQDEEKAVQFFLKKADQIPKSWRTALANALAHEEVEKAHIERIKLDTAAQIRQAFETIWEVHK